MYAVSGDIKLGQRVQLNGYFKSGQRVMCVNAITLAQSGKEFDAVRSQVRRHLGLLLKAYQKMYRIHMQPVIPNNRN